MRRSMCPLMLLAAILALDAQAQQSCDVKTTVTVTGGGGRFLSVMSCGDADLTTEFRCRRGPRSVNVLLPLAPYGAMPGQTMTATFVLSDVKHKKTLTIMRPVRDGAGDMGAAITLKLTDPLWQALSRPGQDIAVELGNESTTVGVRERDASKFEEFKSSCGL